MADDLDAVRALARELIATSTEPDPHALADALLAALTKAQRSALLRWAAGELLREVNRHSRATVRATPTPRVGASWKTAIGTDALLAQRYEVDGVWIELGGCTRDQVLSIAADYRDRAARNLALAEDFERLARRMQRSGASTVADLYGRGERAA